MDPTVTFMHKPVTPQASDAYLTSGFDRVAGFVLRAPDAAAARTPPEDPGHGLTGLRTAQRIPSSWAT